MAETIAWCAERAAEDPKNSLRTPAMLPEGLIYGPSEYEYMVMQPSLGQQDVTQLQALIDRLSEKRAESLTSQQRYPEAPANDLRGGRLLLYDPYENLAEGVEEVFSNGFFDLEAVPPWDTWLCFIEADTVRKGRWQWYSKWLVCWVPEQFVELAHEGLGTSSTGCILWADELDNSLLRQLREAGILPPQTDENLC